MTHIDLAQRIALWRYQIIAPLLALVGPRGILRRTIRQLASRTHDHPLRGPIKIGYGTIEEWFYVYKKRGLDGLIPKPRRDRGRSRCIDDALSEKIETLAKGQPDLDGPGLLAELRAQRTRGEPVPSLSSLYRFLRTHGLDQRRAPHRRDHRAYSFDFANDCWQSDIMFGPSLALPDGSRKKTYLIGILDDATRVIAHAQFYFQQHLMVLKDCLKQALLKRGVCRRLYLDNGKIFRSRLILLMAAQLGIHIIHSRPYRPQGRAKIERWFRRVRRGFLARIDLNRIADLEALNRLFFAWIEGEYHSRPHRGLGGETPLDRWMRLSENIRPLPPEVDLEELFRDEITRRVTKDGTFTLKGQRFEAGPTLIGEKITVRFDPFDLRRVTVSGHDGQKRDAFPVDCQANRRIRRLTDAPPPQRPDPPPLIAIESLAAQRERRPGGNQGKEK